jgi:hypothetical protein
MIWTTMTVKNAQHLRRQLKGDEEFTKKAARAALKQEAYRLSKTLRKEVKQGAPGGVSLAPLGEMAKAGKRKGSRPLARLAGTMRYEMVQKAGVWFARVGHMGTWRSRPKDSSRSWGKIMEIHAAGASIRVTPRMQRKFTSMALGSQGKWKKAGGRSGAKVWVKSRKRGAWVSSGRSGGRTWTAARDLPASPYFVRKDSTLTLPPRRIIEPFWTRHKTRAFANVRRNFERITKAKRRSTTA